MPRPDRRRRHDQPGIPAPPPYPLPPVIALPVLPGAACAEPGADPELWFSSLPRQRAEAEAICQTCPARQACGQWAAGEHVKFGIWGGTQRGPWRRTRDPA